MKRYFILQGDKTTADGTVLEGDESSRCNGTPLSFDGARIYCPACKSEGRARKAPPYWPSGFMGKQALLDGDLCICKCDPPPRLIASQNSMSMSFEAHELAKMGLGPDGTELKNDRPPFDEMYLLKDGSGTPMPDTYYTIKLPSGELRHGVTDASGYTERLNTDLAKQLVVYLGHREA